MALKIADNLELPLDFMTERIAFLARTGSGKSGGMRVLFEQILLAQQFAIFIDPKGDAWGIRADGTGKGMPVLVIGGDHGDIPLEAHGGISRIGQQRVFGEKDGLQGDEHSRVLEQSRCAKAGDEG